MNRIQSETRSEKIALIGKAFSLAWVYHEMNSKKQFNWLTSPDFKLSAYPDPNWFFNDSFFEISQDWPGGAQLFEPSEPALTYRLGKQRLASEDKEAQEFLSLFDRPENSVRFKGFESAEYGVASTDPVIDLHDLGHQGVEIVFLSGKREIVDFALVSDEGILRRLKEQFGKKSTAKGTVVRSRLTVRVELDGDALKDLKAPCIIPLMKSPENSYETYAWVIYEKSNVFRILGYSTADREELTKEEITFWARKLVMGFEKAFRGTFHFEVISKSVAFEKEALETPADSPGILEFTPNLLGISERGGAHRCLSPLRKWCLDRFMTHTDLIIESSNQANHRSQAKQTFGLKPSDQR